MKFSMGRITNIYYTVVFVFICMGFSCNAQSNDLEREYLDMIDYITQPDKEGIDVVIQNYFKGLDMTPQVNDSLKYNFYKSYHWFFRWNRFDREAYKSGLQSLYLAQKFKDYHYLTSVNQHIVEYYVNRKELDSALIFSKKLLKFYDEKLSTEGIVVKNNTYGLNEGIVSSYNNTGFFFKEMLKNNDSALYYFKKGKELSVASNNYDYQFLLHSLNDNTALIYMEQGNYQKAKELFADNYQYYKLKTNDYERRIRAGLQYANAELKLGNEKVFKAKFDNIKFEMDSLQGYFGRLQNDILYHKIAIDFFKKQNQQNYVGELSVELARLLEQNLVDKKAAYTEQIRQLNTVNNLFIDRASLQFAKEKKLRNNEATIRKTIVVLFIIVLLIAMYVIYLIQSKSKIRLKAIQIEKEIEVERTKSAEFKSKLLKKELGYQKKDLALFASVISENQKWGKHLLEKIRKIKKEKSNREVLITELGNEIRQRNSIEKNNLNFQNQVHILSSKFFENLLEKHPNLTKSELKLCSHIRLKLDNSDIATIKNISKESVWKSRTRLRKKLGLPADVSLDLFLQQF